MPPAAALPPKPAATPPPLSPEFGGAWKKGAGPVLTTVDRPVLQSGTRTIQLAHDWSDAHCLDFYQRSRQTARADQLAKATALKWSDLLSEASARQERDTGMERAALAGLVGEGPPIVEPEVSGAVCQGQA